MSHIIRLLILLAAGAVLARLTGIQDIQSSSWYAAAIGGLLAIGLYASTYGIVLSEAKQHLRLILAAVTIGVFLKAAIIGGTLALIFQDPFYLVLGVVVAQIDPLSVAGLMKGKRLSARAKTILGAWASFDDPITVIMALYAPFIVASLTGTEWQSITDATNAGEGLIAYLTQAGVNVLYAVGVFALWTIGRRLARAWLSVTTTIALAATYMFLSLVLSVAAYYFWMLGVALVGLCVRPDIEHIIERATNWALWLAAVMLGVLLSDGITIWKGLALGVAAYGAQVVVGFLLSRRLPHRDRVHIALAQQNGITAIILSLLFEPAFPGTVAIVAPAIITVNLLHYFVNRLADTRLALVRQER